MNFLRKYIETILVLGSFYTVTAETQRAHFIQDLLGISEQSFKTLLNSPTLVSALSIMHDAHHNLIIKTATQSLQCGQFKTITMHELQQQCKHLAQPGNGRFSVVEGINTNNKSPYLNQVDIGALQAHPENNDAVFQVASNFNGLETTFAMQNIDNQLLEEYIFDATQGPCAAISAAPGLLLRRYFLYFDPNTPPQTWQQTTAYTLNFLDNLPLDVTPAGYVVLNAQTLAHQPTSNDYANIKIGFHQNVQVTYGLKLTDRYHIPCSTPQFINQVFTAAFDFGTTNNQWYTNAHAQLWGQMIIKAAYEGTLRAALAANKKKVYLTLVGCGVFKNPLIWVSNALNELKDFIKDSGLDVSLIWYKSNNQHDNFRRKLQQIVSHTGGTYKQYYNNTAW